MSERLPNPIPYIVPYEFLSAGNEAGDNLVYDGLNWTATNHEITPAPLELPNWSTPSAPTTANHGYLYKKTDDAG